MNKYLVEPQNFVEEMERHWTEALGNIASPALRQIWKEIVSAFELHIASHEVEREDDWSVLQPETGTGKTQGTIMYCSMVSKLQGIAHPGILVVTRLTADCDAMVEQINDLTGKEVAVSYHSKNDLNINELKNWPVAVITHSAYERALDTVENSTIEGAWSYFNDWGFNGRKLVVIDEALDIVEENQLTVDELKYTHGSIPRYIEEKNPKEVGVIKRVLKLIDKGDGKTHLKERVIEQEELDVLVGDNCSSADFSGLIASLKDVNFLVGKKDNKENARLRQIHTKRLKALSRMLKTWAYYARHWTKHSINSSRLIVPKGIKGGVILDATANVSLIYPLFGITPLVTRGARSYKNVTLHISKGHRTGKRYLTDFRRVKDVADELRTWMINTIPEGKKVFVCTHKELEAQLIGYDYKFELMTGHWGAVDGSNKWQDCDVGIYFGLPHLPDTKPVNTFFALQGVQDDEWLNGDNRKWNGIDDIRKEIKHSQMVVSLVQAINRLQCRKPIDEFGNCKQTDVFLWLPEHKGLIDSMLNGINREMPNIQLNNFSYDGIKVKRQARANNAAALVAHAKNMSLGKHSWGDIKNALGFSTWKGKDLIKHLKDVSSELSQEMLEIGVMYEVERTGKTQRAYLVK